MEALFIWSQFFLLALIIGLAGYSLTQQADLLAKETGLGRNWVGLVMLATVTSLPELMTGLSAVTIADNPDLAVGNILGSCLFNLFLVFILDLLHRESSVYSKANRGHLLNAALGMILISYVGFSLVVSKQFLALRLGHMGPFALSIPVFYLLAMRMLYNFEHTETLTHKDSSQKLRLVWGKSLVLFFLSAVVVIAAGMLLPYVGEKIVTLMGWNSAFVGTIFLALATALPEMAVTLGAFKIRALDLAFSNVLGSILFNVVILFFDDLFYTKGPLLHSVSPIHEITTFSAVMMTGLVTVALIQKPQKRLLNTVSIFSFLILAIYLLNAFLVFKMGV